MRGLRVRIPAMTLISWLEIFSRLISSVINLFPLLRGSWAEITTLTKWVAKTDSVVLHRLFISKGSRGTSIRDIKILVKRGIFNSSFRILLEVYTYYEWHA